MAEMQTPPYQPGPPSQPMQPHRGTMVLVFGILSLTCCCFIFGLLAWIFGTQDLRAMEAGQMDGSGRSTTNTGRILGIVGTFWSVVVIIAYAAYTVFIVHAVTTGKMPMPMPPR